MTYGQPCIRVDQFRSNKLNRNLFQALFRGHKIRLASDKRAKELRRRWRDGALRSTQESLKERNEEAMDVLRNMADIETVIRAFRSLGRLCTYCIVGKFYYAFELSNEAVKFLT